MDSQETQIPCAFGTLFSKNVPHILEMIFLSLDYKSFKECLEVNKAWKGLLTSELYQMKAKLVFREEILNEQKELWQASMWGKVEVVKRILSYIMVDVNCLGGFNDSTPLGEAASFGHKEVAQLLLQKGADPDRVDNFGQTPLYWAAITGHRGVAEILLDGGADLNRAVSSGKPLLHRAAMRGHKDVVALLLERGADHKSVSTCALLESGRRGWRPGRIHIDKKEEILHQNRKDICKIIRDHKLAKRAKRDPSLLCEAMKKKSKRCFQYRYSLKRCVHRYS